MANFREKIDVIKENFQAQGNVIDKIYFIVSLPFKVILFYILRAYYFLRHQHFEKNPEAKTRAEEKQRRRMEKLHALRRRVIERDKQVAAYMIHAINRFDRKNDAFAEKAAERAAVQGEKFDLAREWAELNKKKLLLQFAGVIVAALCCVGVFNLCTAYEYAYNGRTLGLVDDQEDVLRILDLVSEKLTQEHNAEISIDQQEDITFRRVFSVGKEVDDMEQVLNRLTYMQDIVAHGYGMYINDKRVAIVDSEKTADAILETVKASFMTQSDLTTYEEIGFAEDVRVEKVSTRLGRLENTNDVVQKLLTGSETIETHTVEPGETFSGIAKRYGMSLADLQATNPLVTPERLSIGQEIVLTKAAPMLTVQTVEVSTLTEYIEYQTVYEENPNVYQGENTTKVAGQLGERQVVAKIVRNNGVEVARMELQSQVTKEPVTAVVSMGTKALPPKQGTGSFIYPVTGARLTSKFGSRWGRMHYGIDLAIASGTKIRASDGGTVIFSGYSGSYGYVVKIDHGGGYVTVYAHCSKLHVKVGEKVYQGQHIANVGNTGRSTGPHCHFEVQYLGVQKNPLNYL